MEIEKRPLGTFERSPIQTKLSQVYRVGKKSEEGKQLQDDRLRNFGLVKQEPADCNGSGRNEATESGSVSLLCRASTMLRTPLRGVQSAYKAFPPDGVRWNEPALKIPKPAFVSLLQANKELYSTGSCVTNDAEPAQVGVSGVSQLSTSVNAEPMSRNAKPGSAVGGAGALKFQELTEQTEIAPVKSLMTALVMLQENPIVGDQTKQSGVVTACNANPTSEETQLRLVKIEPVEAKLITALDMFGGGLACSSSPPSSGPESRKDENSPPEAAPTKLMTAMDMFPKFEPLEHPHGDLGCGKSVPPFPTVSVHVKSEPVENSIETRTSVVFKEILKLNAKPPLRKNAVKLEVPNSSGVFTDRKEYQASDISEDCSTGSEDTNDADGGRLPFQLQNEAVMEPEDGVEMLPRRSQKEEDGSQKEIKHRNSNPGRRIQGGRIYDSSFGRTCHWCRQKTVEHHVKCRECTIHYCGPCLMNRNGENVREELCEGVRWLCPKCRNGCGPGCDNCCNCGPCRKADGKSPTGQLVWAARTAGFENAHDYLVHLETGETPQEIARRKVGREWTNCGRFECCKETSEGSQSREEASSTECGDEFTLNEETSTQLHEGKLGMNVVKRFVESQKRKRGAMRGALPGKRSPPEVSPERRRRDVDSILARLKVTGLKLMKETGNELMSASGGLEKQFKAKEEHIQDDVALRNQSTGIRISGCKREYVEENDGNNVPESDIENSAVDKRKLEGFIGDQRHALLSELMSSRSSLLGPFSEVKCKTEPTTFSEETPSIAGVDNSIEAGHRRKFPNGADIQPGKIPSVSESELILKMRGASVLNGVKHGLSNDSSQLMFEQRGVECPSDPQGTEYRTKLKYALAQPFDAKELETLAESAKCRKPVQKLRQMRGRIVDVVTEDEGLSYLDHHQDFASKLEYAMSPPEKLALLRGFFFWLQIKEDGGLQSLRRVRSALALLEMRGMTRQSPRHSCMEGAFRPWPGALTEPRLQSGDCMETEGPDCQVTAVVLQLDEGKEVAQSNEGTEAHHRLKRKFTKKTPRPVGILEEICEPNMNPHPLGSSPKVQTLLPFQVRKSSVQQVKSKARAHSMVQPVNKYRVVLCLTAPALSMI